MKYGKLVKRNNSFYSRHKNDYNNVARVGKAIAHTKINYRPLARIILFIHSLKVNPRNGVFLLKEVLTSLPLSKFSSDIFFYVRAISRV